MVEQYLKNLKLSDRDLDFLVETAAPNVVDKHRLKQIIREDEGFRHSFVTDEMIFGRLMDDDQVLLKISPVLFFEILLRKAVNDLEKVSYTIEKTGARKIPVFDAKEVVELLTMEPLLLYLADMLSSFARVERYTLSIMVREGVWEKFRFSDLDIFSLMSFCEVVEDEQRFGFYKRIADICLFILGIFPEYVEREDRYPFSGEVRPSVRGKARIGPEDYEKEGRKFYKLAAEHQSAEELALSEVFWALHENFQKAKKPLNFIADNYLRYKRQKLFR